MGTRASPGNSVLSKVRVLYNEASWSGTQAKVQCIRCTCIRPGLCENCTLLGISDRSEALVYFAEDKSLMTMTVHQLQSLFHEREKAFGKLPLLWNPLSVYVADELVAVVNTRKQLGFSVGALKRALSHYRFFCHISGSSLRGVISGNNNVSSPGNEGSG